MPESQLEPACSSCCHCRFPAPAPPGRIISISCGHLLSSPSALALKFSFAFCKLASILSFLHFLPFVFNLFCKCNENRSSPGEEWCAVQLSLPSAHTPTSHLNLFFHLSPWVPLSLSCVLLNFTSSKDFSASKLPLI